MVKPCLERSDEVVFAKSNSLPFRAKDTFVKQSNPSAGVVIAEVWPDFKEWFLDKVEEFETENAIVVYELVRSVGNNQIYEDLHGPENAIVSLKTIYRLLTRQPNGEPGPLRTNGFGNIFYARDVNDVVREVYLRWSEGGWHVSCGRIGYRVFVPKSAC